MPSTLRATSITPVHYSRRIAAPLAAAISAALVAAACASRPAAAPTTAPLPDAGPRLTVAAGPAAAAAPGAPGAAATVAAPTPRALVVATADGVVGTRYRYGGTSPKRGFDCSGFVHWVYAQQGIDLPRTTRGLTTAGTRIPARRDELLPGDLLLFAGHGTRITHVAIYVGDGRIIHASSGQREVRYDDLDSARGRWFRRHVVSARRVMGEPPGAQPPGAGR